MTGQRGAATVLVIGLCGLIATVGVASAALGVLVDATDLEVGIRHQVSGVDIQVPGTAVLSVTRFGSILRESNPDNPYQKTEVIETPGATSIEIIHRYFRIHPELILKSLL